MMGWYGSGMGGAGPFMWMFMGLFWIALIGLIIWLVVKLLPGSGAPPVPLHHDADVAGRRRGDDHRRTLGADCTRWSDRPSRPLTQARAEVTHTAAYRAQIGSPSLRRHTVTLASYGPESVGVEVDSWRGIGDAISWW